MMNLCVLQIWSSRRCEKNVAENIGNVLFMTTYNRERGEKDEVVK